MHIADALAAYPARANTPTVQTLLSDLEAVTAEATACGWTAQDEARADAIEAEILALLKGADSASDYAQAMEDLADWREEVERPQPEPPTAEEQHDYYTGDAPERVRTATAHYPGRSWGRALVKVLKVDRGSIFVRLAHGATGFRFDWHPTEGAYLWRDESHLPAEQRYRLRMARAR